jgi:hypothetical protein
MYLSSEKPFDSNDGRESNDGIDDEDELERDDDDDDDDDEEEEEELDSLSDDDAGDGAVSFDVCRSDEVGFGTTGGGDE